MDPSKDIEKYWTWLWIILTTFQLVCRIHGEGVCGNSNNGIINNGIYCKTTHFTDGIALLGNNEEELQNVVYKMNTILKNICKMMVNKEKGSHEMLTYSWMVGS